MAAEQPVTSRFALPGSRAFALACAALWVSTLGGCEFVRSASTPMTALSVTHRSSEGCLVVLMPGMGDTPQHFLDHGFVEEARSQGLRCDFVLPDAHLTYYREQNVAERVVADVLVAARTRGYRRIWLVGISLGATGAIEAARRRPDLVDGLVLIAPFLGPEDRVLAALDGDTTPPARQHLLVHVAPRATWLARVARSRELPLLVAFGTEDRYARNHGRLAEMLGGSSVVTRTGAHDWATWRALWTEIAPRLVHLDQRSAERGLSETRRRSGPG